MVSGVELKFDRLASMMDERLQRRWAACEALALGYGGVSAVARATGLSRTTIRRGIEEIQGTMPDLARELNGRVRRPGGGCPAISKTDVKLVKDLELLIADSTRGDPMSPLLWTCYSTRRLAEELRQRGHVVRGAIPFCRRLTGHVVRYAEHSMLADGYGILAVGE